MGGETQDRGQSTLQGEGFTLEFSDPKENHSQASSADSILKDVQSIYNTA